MKKKQFLALALSVVMAGGMLAGCGSSNGSSSSSKGDAKDEVVTLKWIQVGNGMPKDYDEWLAQINPYLEEKIGVNVDMEIVPWGDWDNRRSVITNSGEYFDILFTDQNRYSSEVNTGALMDITDLLKDNASELYDMIPEDYWKAVEVNGKIYGVPTYKDSSLSEYFVWDQDIADKYNIDVNSVTDFNTLYDALKTVKEGEGGSPYFMSKNGANFLLNLNYDDLSSGLPASALNTAMTPRPLSIRWMTKKSFPTWTLFVKCIRKVSSTEMLRQQMIPANTQCSLLHRDGAALQKQHGARTMVSPIVQQYSMATQSFPTQPYVVPSMVSTPDANTRTKHFSF